MWIKQNAEGKIEVIGVDEEKSKEIYMKHQLPPELPVN
jgi:hypothetical protein